MSSDLVPSTGLLFALLALSFYFSSTETAVTSLGRAKMLDLESTYPKSKDSIQWLGNNIQRALTVTLVGNNLVNIAASSIATVVASRVFAAYGPVVAIIVMTSLIVVFCEILPKNIAITHKEKVILTSLPALKLFNVLLSPIIFVVQKIVWAIGKLFGLGLDAYQPFVTREDVESIVRASGVSGALEEDERKMIHGVISFEETRVSEIMVPRIDMASFESETTVEAASAIFLETGHSRIPIYEKDLDKILGMVYAKDLLGPLSKGLLQEPVDSLLRKPLFIPETLKTDEAFELMKESQIHIAIVVDEYGGTAGLVSLEDLLEEIVGDIQDEFDDEATPILEEEPGVYLVQGYVHLEDLSEALDYPFDFEEVDTVAGMILSLCGNFPESGFKIQYGPWDIETVEVTDHRILQVRMRKMSEETTEQEG